MKRLKEDTLYSFVKRKRIQIYEDINEDQSQENTQDENYNGNYVNIKVKANYLDQKLEGRRKDESMKDLLIDKENNSNTDSSLIPNIQFKKQNHVTKNEIINKKSLMLRNVDSVVNKNNIELNSNKNLSNSTKSTNSINSTKSTNLTNMKNVFDINQILNTKSLIRENNKLDYSPSAIRTSDQFEENLKNTTEKLDFEAEYVVHIGKNCKFSTLSEFLSNKQYSNKRDGLLIVLHGDLIDEGKSSIHLNVRNTTFITYEEYIKKSCQKDINLSLKEQYISSSKNSKNRDETEIPDCIPINNEHQSSSIDSNISSLEWRVHKLIVIGENITFNSLKIQCKLLKIKSMLILLKCTIRGSILIQIESKYNSIESRKQLFNLPSRLCVSLFGFESAKDIVSNFDSRENNLNSNEFTNTLRSSYESNQEVKALIYSEDTLIHSDSQKNNQVRNTCLESNSTSSQKLHDISNLLSRIQTSQDGDEFKYKLIMEYFTQIDKLLHYSQTCDVYIKDCDISNLDSSALTLTGKSRVFAQNSNFHDTKASTILTIEQSSIVLYKCSIYRTKHSGICTKNKSTSIVVECNIHQCMYPNIYVSDQSVLIGSNIDSHSSEQNGIAVRDNSKIFLENCNFWNNSCYNVHLTGSCICNLGKCNIYYGGLGGVWIKDNSKVKFSSCEIYSNFKHNIVASGNSNPWIENCVIHSATCRGILIEDSVQGIFRNNSIYSNRQSNIEIRRFANPLFEGNKIFKSMQCGVYIHDKSKGKFIGNDIYENEHSNVFTCGQSTPIFLKNQIHDGKQSGICCKDYSKATFSQNEIFNNAYFNIKLSDFTESQIHENYIHHSEKPGINVRGYAKGNITKNIIQNCETGIHIEEILSANPIISDNRTEEISTLQTF